MAKKNKKKTPQKTIKRHGFDYAFIPRGLVVGSVDFIQLLYKSNIFAISFGHQYSEDFKSYIPLISLVGTEIDPLINVFSQFEKWSESSDGDAVELTTVFKNDGTYVIGIGPELERLRQRCLGFDHAMQPFFGISTWLKQMDKTSSYIRDFGKYCRNIVSPFYLSAAIYTDNIKNPDISKIKHTPEIKTILKMSANFLEERDIKENSKAWMFIAPFKKSQSKQNDETLAPDQISRTRNKFLRTHFPVTLERLKKEQHLILIWGKANELGAQLWQFEQAISNILLSYEISEKPYFEAYSRRKLDEKIIDHLRNRFELADSNYSLLNSISSEMVLEQIILDSITLLNNLRIKVRDSSINSLLELLKKHNLLNEKNED